MIDQSIVDNGAALNAYPDSIGGRLGDIVKLLSNPEMRGAFSSFYILPSVYNTDLDRGFSVIDYNLNELLASPQDLANIKMLGIDLKLDFILNHASVLSPQFQDLLQNGEHSLYKDFFINWNEFWAECGTMTDGGYIQPDEQHIKNMFFRKPSLPILMVRMPDGLEVPYWNTFYQEIQYPKLDEQDVMSAADVQYLTAQKITALVNDAIESGRKPGEIQYGQFKKYKDTVTSLLENRRRYLGQMDLNVSSPLVWEFYEKTLQTLAGYGATIVRLDAFAYASKIPGEKNFLNVPETWDILKRIRTIADQYGIQLLPEIHASYGEGIYAVLADEGYMSYDFFLPGLLIDALESGDGSHLARWANELKDKKIRVVNMLGCHDGIPMLDLKGLLSDERIEALIDILKQRGGYVKNLHGKKNMYYQVNCTYFSALGESEAKLLLARAVQLFMPGKPQIWYLDLFAGKNDHDAAARAGAGGHKEINRTNLTGEQALRLMESTIVKSQLEILKFRNTFPAFGFSAESTFQSNADGSLAIEWRNSGCVARLDACLADCSFSMEGLDESGRCVFNMQG